MNPRQRTRVIAFDLGASGGKCFAGIFERGRLSIQEVSRYSYEAIPLHVAGRTARRVERVYWNDLEIYFRIIEGLKAYRKDVAGQVDAIGIDAWGSDGMLMSPDGDPLGRMYAYRDHRLDPMIEAVKSRIDPLRMYRVTGIHFQPFNISNQLHWLVLNRADLLLKGAFFLPTPSLFTWYLGGGCQVDSSWASVTQLMDAQTGAWSDEVLNALGIPGGILPEIVRPGTVVGELLPPGGSLNSKRTTKSAYSCSV